MELKEVDFTVIIPDGKRGIYEKVIVKIPVKDDGENQWLTAKAHQIIDSAKFKGLLKQIVELREDKENNEWRPIGDQPEFVELELCVAPDPENRRLLPRYGVGNYMGGILWDFPWTLEPTHYRILTPPEN